MGPDFPQHHVPTSQCCLTQAICTNETVLRRGCGKELVSLNGRSCEQVRQFLQPDHEAADLSLFGFPSLVPAARR